MLLRSAQGIVVDGAVLSDPGRDPEKQVNEDSLALTETRFGIAAVVCDGMGGHERGELASRSAVERILEVLRGGVPPLERLLSTALERAHAEVYALGGEAAIDARPGSTAVVLVLSGREALLAHVGDSRAYRVRQGRSERLTRDHSVIEALLLAGALTPEQASLHPDANRITRALGIAPEVDPEVSAPVHAEVGDLFVLCTDGLSDLVSEAELAELLSDIPSAEFGCESLVALANQRGGHDNISVIVLKVLALGQARPTANQQGTEGHTVMEQPGFTVVMNASEGVPQTVSFEQDARHTLPTVVDPMILAQNTPRTLPDGALPRAAPTPPHASSSPSPAVRPHVSQRGVTDPGLGGRPPEGEVRLLLWGTVAVCAVILGWIAIWWLVR